MRALLAVPLLALLAACGADAPPTAAPGTDVTVSGEARFGVVFAEGG